MIFIKEHLLYGIQLDINSVRDMVFDIDPVRVKEVDIDSITDSDSYSNSDTETDYDTDSERELVTDSDAHSNVAEYDVDSPGTVELDWETDSHLADDEMDPYGFGTDAAGSFKEEEENVDGVAAKKEKVGAKKGEENVDEVAGMKEVVAAKKAEGAGKVDDEMSQWYVRAGLEMQREMYVGSELDRSLQQGEFSPSEGGFDDESDLDDEEDHGYDDRQSDNDSVHLFFQNPYSLYFR